MGAKELQRLCREMEEAQELLMPFGLTVIGYSPGVSAVDKLSAYSFDFYSHMWSWLKPLLIELKEYRQKKEENKSNE